MVATVARSLLMVAGLFGPAAIVIYALVLSLPCDRPSPPRGGCAQRVNDTPLRTPAHPSAAAAHAVPSVTGCERRVSEGSIELERELGVDMRRNMNDSYGYTALSRNGVMLCHPPA